jgi:signal transduction histidine kinase
LSVPHTGDELERLSSTLNAMLQRLDGAVRRMTQFTADASHELRAPLALIRTTAEVALRKERTPVEYREAISQVLAESERTSELVGSLLMLARADAGKDNPPLAPMDLTESVREAFEQGQTLAVEKGIKLESGIPPHPVNIEGDPQAIRRVFLILIDNAIKYTGKNGVVNVSLSTFNGTVKGVVRDSGIGISDRDQPYLFDRFWRADKVRSRELGGIGLGLSIAKVIVERHGGRIEVKSTLGGGSAFSVEFPATSKKSE